LSNDYESYVHRIGRTGRAGKSGVSYSFINIRQKMKTYPTGRRALLSSYSDENCHPVPTRVVFHLAMVKFCTINQTVQDQCVLQRENNYCP
ncbi:MAG: hypothetical protein Q8763_02805, partial [Candidatus Phytoplasma australasiaticum]|nr:hypothetical protein [Candidatus Phytoplasma australasiaticum]